MASLTEIANVIGCDKGTNAHERHGYTAIYSQDIRSGMSLLEIGIDRGLSLQMWRQWDRKLSVTAIDIDTECVANARQDGHCAVVCDQSDAGALRSLASTIGDETQDIIIDDGSHRPDDQLLTLSLLWPCLKSNGVYFIEDLHVSAWFPEAARAPKRIVQFASDKKAPLSFHCNSKLARLEKK